MRGEGCYRFLAAFFFVADFLPVFLAVAAAAFLVDFFAVFLLVPADFFPFVADLPPKMLSQLSANF